MASLATLFPDPAPPKLAAGHQGPCGLSEPWSKIRLEPDNVRNGLLQLVLTLVELIRELLERQALRRIDAGSLTQEQIERLGLTFLRLSEEMERLKRQLGFTDEDLNIDLGPLGKLR